MRPPATGQGGVTPAEALLWRRVTATVRPIGGRAAVPAPTEDLRPTADPSPDTKPRAAAPPVRPPRSPPPRSPDNPDGGLDATWDRRLARGLIEPDFTLDLHGATLDAAHQRLDRGLAQARAMSARLVLLIAGRPRPVEAADRGQARGAIRAKLGDWIAAGAHAGNIAAIRPAHRRHGGAGALYLVLRRRR